MVARQTQTNGDVHFLVMVDGVSYLQLVNTQRSVVATGNMVLAGVQSTQGSVAPIVDAAGGNPVWSLGAGAFRQAASTSAWGAEPASPAGAWALSSNQRPLDGTSRLAAADITWTSMGMSEDDSPGDGLRTASLLGQPGSQPAAAGLLSTGNPSFDYWVESLTL